MFASMKVAVKHGKKATHKAILLLSVIKLIEDGLIQSNQIVLSDILIAKFKQCWDRCIGDSSIFQAKIATSYWHLQNEAFWKLISFDGAEVTKNNIIGSMYSVNNLRNQVKYTEIDSELFELLQSEVARGKIKGLLLNTYLNDKYLQK